MQELILRLNKSIKQTEWELKNTSKDTNAWYLIQGRLNGYNHILSMIDDILTIK